MAATRSRSPASVGCTHGTVKAVALAAAERAAFGCILRPLAEAGPLGSWAELGPLGPGNAVSNGPNKRADVAAFQPPRHHTSLLWDYTPARMALLQQPAKQPEYRRHRPHESFVQGLSASLPCRDAFGRALVAAAGARFELEQVQLEEALPALEAKHRSVTCLVDLAATMAAPSGDDKSGVYRVGG